MYVIITLKCLLFKRWFSHCSRSDNIKSTNQKKLLPCFAGRGKTIFSEYVHSKQVGVSRVIWVEIKKKKKKKKNNSQVHVAHVEQMIAYKQHTLYVAWYTHWFQEGFPDITVLPLCEAGHEVLLVEAELGFRGGTWGQSGSVGSYRVGRGTSWWRQHGWLCPGESKRKNDKMLRKTRKKNWDTEIGSRGTVLVNKANEIT